LSSSTTTRALVTTEWVAEHGKDKGLRIIEVDVDPSAYDKGHIEGAVGWNWRKHLQDQVNRDIASKEALANLLGQSGVTPDTTILLYGDNNNWFAAYAYWALKYALDAANGVTHSPGQPGGGAPTLQMVSYAGDTNLGDPIVAPFVTKATQSFTITPVDGQSGTVTSTPVSDNSLWGNVYGSAHGGVCSSSAS